MKKQALITGATSGIGRATALRLSADGWDVAATGRRAERLLDALRREIEAAGGGCRTLAFDIRDEAACHAALDGLERIDLLVNNAGLAAGFEHLDRGSTADWNAMIDTNVKGLLYVSQIVARKMIAAGGGQSQHRLDRRHRTLRERRRLLRHQARRARHFAIDARRPALARHQGERSASRHGRDRILGGALPRRPHGCRQRLSGRRGPSRATT